jgi:lysyl-tRNA synthetase class II
MWVAEQFLYLLYYRSTIRYCQYARNLVKNINNEKIKTTDKQSYDEMENFVSFLDTQIHKWSQNAKTCTDLHGMLNLFTEDEKTQLGKRVSKYKWLELVDKELFDHFTEDTSLEFVLTSPQPTRKGEPGSDDSWSMVSG